MQPRASFIYKYFLLSYPPLPTLQLRRKLKLNSIIPAEDIEFLMLFLSVTVNIATFPWEFLESLIFSFYLFFCFGFLSFVALLYSLLDIDITHLKRAFTVLTKKLKKSRRNEEGDTRTLSKKCEYYGFIFITTRQKIRYFHEASVSLEKMKHLKKLNVQCLSVIRFIRDNYVTDQTRPIIYYRKYMNLIWPI